MAVMVEEVQTAKSGKSLRVKLGGTWYGAAMASGLNGAKGKMIEAEIQTSDKYGPWINAYKEVAGSAPAAPAAAPVQETRHPEPQYAQPTNNGQAPFWLPMCSNVVAHAIAAGKIEEPGQVAAWVNAVRGCFTSPTQDDDITY